MRSRWRSGRICAGRCAAGLLQQSAESGKPGTKRAEKARFFHARGGANAGTLGRRCARGHPRRCGRGMPTALSTLPPGRESFASSCARPQAPLHARKIPHEKNGAGAVRAPVRRSGSCGAVPELGTAPAGAKRERGQLLILRSGTRSGEVFSFCAVAVLQARCRRFRGIVRIHPRGRRGALRPRRSGARWFPE